jgi:hypothetical protein
MLGVPFELTKEQEIAFVHNNPESYLPYLFLGDYFKTNENFKKAISYYQESLRHQVSSLNEQNVIREKIAECKK